MLRLALFSTLALGLVGAASAELRETVKRVKPSIVGVGTYFPTRQPPGRLLGTGFVVGSGRQVLTNAHVFRASLEDPGNRRGRPPEEFAVAFVQRGDRISYDHVVLVAEDAIHDVALLEFTGKPLPALTLGDDTTVEEGQDIAFTGFPLGAVLGLHPVTHRGIVSAITPIARPMSGEQLDGTLIGRLKDAFDVFQLDAIAYPGNSGSPLYNPESGEVYGILASAFVKESKEKALSSPSGISYAIPIRYAQRLLEEGGDATSGRPR